MKEFEIRLCSVQQVLSFVHLATSRVFPIYVSGKHHRVNAKSFMEMFSLNLRRPVRVSLECTDEEYEAFLRDADQYLVK